VLLKNLARQKEIHLSKDIRAKIHWTFEPDPTAVSLSSFERSFSPSLVFYYQRDEGDSSWCLEEGKASAIAFVF